MNLLFDFTVDKTANTINITREFAADLDLVWDAFTKPEILDQWMGPKPWRVETKVMDFRVGGRWMYAMVSPEKVAGYSLVEFTEIKPKTTFTSRNSFCDENGNPVSTSVTYSITSHTFKETAGVTTVQVVKKMNSLAELEQFIAMGFKQGFEIVLRNLEDLLQEMSVNK